MYIYIYIGFIISVNIFIWLNSPTFLNENFNFNIKTPLLTCKEFCLSLGIFIILITFYILLCKKEKEENGQEDSPLDSEKKLDQLDQ